MKLLKKQEIEQKKASEKRQQIEEGLSLARRVDSLREVASKEEASLVAFRENTLKDMNEELTTLRTERDALKGEVTSLQEERVRLREPLDVEWADAKAEHVRADERNAACDLRESNVKQAEIANAKRAGVLDERERKVIQDSTESGATLKHATEMMDEVEEILLSIQSEKAETAKAIEKRETELLERENAVKEREAEVSKVEQGFDARKKEQDDRDIQFASRYASLAQTEKDLRERYGTNFTI